MLPSTDTSGTNYKARILNSNLMCSSFNVIVFKRNRCEFLFVNIRMSEILVHILKIPLIVFVIGLVFWPLVLKATSIFLVNEPLLRKIQFLVCFFPCLSLLSLFSCKLNRAPPLARDSHFALARFCLCYFELLIVIIAVSTLIWQWFT